MPVTGAGWGPHLTRPFQTELGAPKRRHLRDSARSYLLSPTFFQHRLFSTLVTMESRPDIDRHKRYPPRSSGVDEKPRAQERDGATYHGQLPPYVAHGNASGEEYAGQPGADVQEVRGRVPAGGGAVQF